MNRMVEDDDSADESETISTRTLALTRYRRNHEFMNEVFVHAAFRTSSFLKKICFHLHNSPGNLLEKPEESKPAYSIFKLDDIEAKIVRTAALLLRIMI